jgi:hypothetical protein
MTIETRRGREGGGKKGRKVGSKASKGRRASRGGRKISRECIACPLSHLENVPDFLNVPDRGVGAKVPDFLNVPERAGMKVPDFLKVPDKGVGTGTVRIEPPKVPIVASSCSPILPSSTASSPSSSSSRPMGRGR